MTLQIQPDDRAISEILGTVLLVSLVLFGSATVIVLGADALNEAQQSTQTESAAAHLQQLDAQLSTLSAADDDPQTAFDPRDGMARQFNVERDGYINVTVNDNPTCSFEQNFSTIVYEDSQGRTVGYEAGGVWRGRQHGGSSAVSPPDITFVNGRLGVELVNLTGHVDQSINVARLNRTATRNRTRVALDALRQGNCVRPDNLTIRVESRFQAGWRNYLASETGADDGNVTTSSGGVEVFVNQSYLHPSVNDSENNVIDLSPPYPSEMYKYGTSPTRNGSPAPPTLGVDKGVGNNYSVFVEPLSEGSLGILSPRERDDQEIPGPPKDIVLVMDESGSMARDDGDSTTRSEEAKEGARIFVGTRNSSLDQIGIVSYDTDARYRRTDNERYITSDFSLNGVNGSIGDIPDSPNGGTRADKGLNRSNVIHDLKGNESRQRYTVLLTDGVNNGCDDPDGDLDPTPDADPYDCQNNLRAFEAVNHSRANNIEIYTIGFGADSEIDEAFLQEVANRTGGAYCQAENASSVHACFREFGESFAAGQSLGSLPMSSNVTAAGSSPIGADIPGETSHIERINDGNYTHINVNDPTAPTLFSHSFVMGDGETASFNISRYDCNQWNRTGGSRTINGTTYALTRCTDIGDFNKSFDAEVYVDGDDPDQLLLTSYEPWQQDVNTTLDAFPSVNINSSTGILETKSNQALVVFDLQPESSTTTTKNTFTLLFQIGLAESEGQGIVDVHVAEAELSNS